MAATCTDPVRKAELLQISQRTVTVFQKTELQNFYEACQSFWFVQALVQIESVTDISISPGRFDQYMWPILRSRQEHF